MRDVRLIDQDGTELWKLPTRGRQIDCWLLADGHVVTSYNKGTCEIRADAGSKKGVVEVWNRPAPKGAELDGCFPLPDDTVLISESYPGRVELVEVERGTLQERKRVVLKPSSLFSEDPHANSRHVRRTSRGTYLIGLRHDREQGGAEFDADGRLLRRFPGANFAVYELPDGGYLGAGGKSGCLVGYDAEGAERWRIDRRNAGEIDGLTLGGFVSGVDLLPDGSMLLTCYKGKPGLILLAPDRTRVLRSWNIPATTVQVVPDELADAVIGGGAEAK